MKLLHLSFHKGCINDFQYVCDKLGYTCEILGPSIDWNSNNNTQF